MTDTAFDYPYRVRIGSSVTDVVGLQIGHYAVREALDGQARIKTAGNVLVRTSGYVVDHVKLQITVVGNLQFEEALSAADSLSLYAVDPSPSVGWAKCDPYIHEWLCSVTLGGFTAYESWRQKRRLCRLPKKIERLAASKRAREFSL